MQRQHKKRRKTEEKSDSVTAAVQQPDNAYLVNGAVPDEILAHIDSYLPALSDKSSLAEVCVHLHSIFQPPLNESPYKRLAQAVIDDDRETIKKLLDGNPSLVFYTPSKGIVIESQLTWQRFYLTENVFTIAAKRKQLDVLAFLDSYCDQIKPINNIDPAAARTEALSAWTFYKMRTNKKGEEEIVIPKDYADYAQELIDVFKKETFPGGKLSDDTEVALVSLFDRLLPEKAVRLDGYLDPELLLLAVYRAYRDNFTSFNYNWNQLDAFCIRVIGLIQSVQTPGTAKIICEGLDDVVAAEEKGIKKEISTRATEHKLKRGQSFYRSSRDSLTGLGSDYFVGIYGHGTAWLPRSVGTPVIGGAAGRAPGCGRLEKLCQAKATSFRNFTRQSTSLRDQHSVNHKQRRCVIS
jgi:hypothetical protein